MPLSVYMLTKLNLQNSYDKVKFMVIIQFALVFGAFIAEAVATKTVFYFSFIFQFVVIVAAFNFYYKALSNLFYSYWNISVILVVYYMVSMARNFFTNGLPMIGSLFVISLFLLIWASYIISSPLYYPRVHWWEYDFRFRADIRCLVEVDDHQYRGRLSDLRRGAACLELFNPIQVGQPVQINIEILNQNFTLSAEVRSKREPIIGRSMVYGVRFNDTDLENRQRLKFLTNYWKESKKIKIRNKFALSEK